MKMSSCQVMSRFAPRNLVITSQYFYFYTDVYVYFILIMLLYFIKTTSNEEKK